MALSACEQIGVTQIVAEEWWHSREGSEWTKGSNGTAIAVGSNWRSDLKSFDTNKKNREAEAAAKLAAQQKRFSQPMLPQSDQKSTSFSYKGEAFHVKP